MFYVYMHNFKWSIGKAEYILLYTCILDEDITWSWLLQYSISFRKVGALDLNL